LFLFERHSSLIVTEVLKDLAPIGQILISVPVDRKRSSFGRPAMGVDAAKRKEKGSGQSNEKLDARPRL